ncbi:MAG: J domain-containing protein [Opitutales bacterium]|nr:J domain-containing protein [Opitutales bacterium]
MDFKDYYKILGVDRSATQEEIKRTFRKLARECHPDHAASEGKEAAESRFKEINEAYEVLGDAEKRRKYDSLGAEWKAQSGARAQGWQAGEEFFGSRAAGTGPGGYEYHFGGTGFSDFFEQFFGGAGARGFAGGPDSRFRGTPFSDAEHGARRGNDIESEIVVTFEEALHGSVRSISLRRLDPHSGAELTETVRVRLPAGVREGQRIRVAGKGAPGPAGAGDLFLRVCFERHPDFRVEDNNLVCDLELAPWEAVLGCSVEIPTLEGKARVRVKAGTQGGSSLRLRGRGLPLGKGRRGDLLARVRIRVPQKLSAEEKALWERLAAETSFSARED